MGEHSKSLGSESFASIMERRISRRALLKGGAMLGLGAIASQWVSRAWAENSLAATSLSTLTFQEIPHTLATTHEIAPGYSAQLIARWGDRVLPGAPAFDSTKQSREAQEQQFGYNCDYIAYLPWPVGSDASDHGLLCVNHEFTLAHLMFGKVDEIAASDEITREQMEIEQAAHGVSVIEIERLNGAWHTVNGSPYNRRITATSEIIATGPAAGHKRLQTKADPTGTKISGTISNCAGGVTPWGTVLTCEENFNLYFSSDYGSTDEASNHKRYNIGKKSPYTKFYYGWRRFEERFDVAKSPNEPNRFGWVVEYDPYDPSFTPRKRTALGRFMHESASPVLTPAGRVAVYMGDDQLFEYLYRFVTKDAYNAKDRTANRDLLDEGVLYVAKFHDSGTLTWMPLLFGSGPLTPENGFHSQADVMIEARRAADLLGATPMDRPEDVEPNPKTGKIYVVLTKNKERTEINAANPRAKNLYGHIIELTPPTAFGQVDHGALTYQWDIFLLAGDPADAAHGARYGAGTSSHGWLTNPDNVAFDPQGRLWITTDGQDDVGFSDAVYAADTEGAGRAATKHFFNAPRGAEISGPYFTPDGTTLFLSIGHPGREQGSTYDSPSTRWPDFSSGPPRPTVIAVVKNDGGEVGS